MNRMQKSQLNPNVKGRSLPPSRRNLTEVLQDFFVAEIIHFLVVRGILRCLRDEQSVSQIASATGYDEPLLRAILDFTSWNSDVIDRVAVGRYRVNSKYNLEYVSFQAEKFIGAYGPAASRLHDALRLETLGASLVNGTALARAFEVAPQPNTTTVGQIIKGLGIRSLMDLGCGPGALLRELCTDDLTFRGWGVDANRSMCAVARKRLRSFIVEGRATIVRSDVRDLEKVFDCEERQLVDAVHGRSLLNEFFRFGSEPAIAIVALLKRLFPSKIAIFVDYYGKLSHTTSPQTGYEHTHLHDLIQMLSGQGIPPATRRGWQTVYKRGGARLAHTFEGKDDGIDWFVDIVQL